jgi:hypothetical protein
LSTDVVNLMNSLYSVFYDFSNSDDLRDSVSHGLDNDLISSFLIELGNNVFHIVAHGSTLVNSHFIIRSSLPGLVNLLVFFHC